MNAATIFTDIENATRALLGLARSLTNNRISDHCRFILTEIKHREESFHTQRVLLRKVNAKKTPVSLQEIMPRLAAIYSDLYDIELYVYKASKKMTVVDIRYFLKSSLDKDYQLIVCNNPPMLHSKVSMPPWLRSKTSKFDINWEHQHTRNRLKLTLAKFFLFASH